MGHRVEVQQLRGYLEEFMNVSVVHGLSVSGITTGVITCLLICEQHWVLGQFTDESKYEEWRQDYPGYYIKWRIDDRPPPTPRR